VGSAGAGGRSDAVTNISRAQFESIVEAGILAPSADNRQPLQFELSESTILLWGTRDFANASFHRRVLHLIGFGAIAENMLLRASRLGLAGEIEWFPGRGSEDVVARAHLSPASADSEDIEAEIPRRQTNRRLFRGPPIGDCERERLQADVARIPGVSLIWFDEPVLRRRMLRLLLIAEAERFRCQPLHEDLFSSIRFDVGWVATTDQGLPPAALEIEAPLRWAFHTLRHWPLMRALDTIGAHYLIAARAAYLPCQLAPHLCALVTALPLDDGCLAVGRALERAWLRATGLGLALQPFAAPALLALDGYREVRTSIRNRLAKGWAELAPGFTPLIAFRMGHAAEPSVRAGRPPTRTYILDDGGR
jgi:hypothetical protein